MSEIRPIPFAPGYFVSDDGQIFSERRGARRALAQNKSGDYASVTLYVEAMGSTTPVHRIVCLVFHGSPAAGQEVRHLDGSKRHNAASNMLWGTRVENMADKHVHDTDQIGSRNGNAVLVESDVQEIKRLLAHGERQTDIAARFGVTQANISEIARGRTWAHVHGPNMARRTTRRGGCHTSAKLTDESVLTIRELARYGASQKSIAEKFGVTRSNVSAIVMRKTWTSVI